MHGPAWHRHAPQIVEFDLTGWSQEDGTQLGKRVRPRIIERPQQTLRSSIVSATTSVPTASASSSTLRVGSSTRRASSRTSSSGTLSPARITETRLLTPQPQPPRRGRCQVPTPGQTNAGACPSSKAASSAATRRAGAANESVPGPTGGAQSTDAADRPRYSAGTSWRAPSSERRRSPMSSESGSTVTVS